MCARLSETRHTIAVCTANFSSLLYNYPAIKWCLIDFLGMSNLKIERLHIILDQHTSIVHVLVLLTTALVGRHRVR